MKARVLSTLILAAAFSALAGPAGFKVIVNNANGATKIRRTDLNAIFLKKTVTWSDGAPVTPVNQSKSAIARASFTAAVHAKSVAAVESYWQQQIFSGRDVPPLERDTDADVIAFVRSHPGAIGYVSDAAVTSGVKVVDTD